MKLLRWSPFALIFSFVIFACQKNNIDPDPVPPSPPDDTATVNYPTKSVQIQLPANAKIDLATLEVHSLSQNGKVSVAGTAKTAYNSGYPSIAWVFDQQDRPLLAGFITDSSSEINTKSTAKVLLYFGYATLMEQYAMTAEFLKGIDQVKGSSDWYKAFDDLFKADPLVLDKGSFKEPLRQALKNISGGRKINTPTTPAVAPMTVKKIPDVEVLANTEKSGLRISSLELGKLQMENIYRRRAWAFLYKVKTTFDNGNMTTETIESTTRTQTETSVDPSGGFTSVAGVLGAWIEGPDKVQEFFAMKSGPFDIPMADDEKEGEYKLRIVGPGFPGTNKTISSQEIEKLTQLEIETLALDFLLPVMMEVVGNKDDLALIDGSRHVTGPLETFIEKTGSAIKLMPPVYEEMRKGNYKGATQKFIEALYLELNAALFEDMVKLTAGVLEMLAQQKYYIPSGADVFKDAERKTKILKVIDLGLFATDLARMGFHIAKSSQLEEWTVRARGPKVTLLPDSSTLVPLMEQKITCEIKNFVESGGDTHAFYEWKTSGKYGKISDTKGHVNQVSFNTSDNIVSYQSLATASQLKDGDNIDYIYVTVKFGSTVIGRDTAIVNVKKNKFEMNPKGVTLSGKKYAGSWNEVMMKLNKVDKKNEIGADPDVDWKIVWSTAGKYGKLLGPGVDNMTTITQYNTNSISYECQDDDTKEAVEKISAKIYSKLKIETEYVFYDEVFGEVKINNDDKKKILHIPFSFVHGDTSTPASTYTSYKCWKGNGVFVPRDPEAKMYTLRFYNISSVTIGAPSTVSWYADKNPGYAPAAYAADGWVDGKWFVTYSWGSANGPRPGHSSAGPKSGMAEVTIILK
ncbi:hypothetical protein [Pollutibacter soli]|uniref:hypothetical protein n=1 Tax=Pollutibacter soli TaxID=3034157 RepID=UPI0030139CA5